MKLIRMFTVVLLALFAGAAVAASGQLKVVYHVTHSDNASAALHNIRNHLTVSPKAKIVVVAHGPGIDFLIEGAKNPTGNPYDVPVQELAGRGVEFRVCNNTLEGRKIDKSKLLPEARIVPSGVAEVARLQAEEGYVYIKP